MDLIRSIESMAKTCESVSLNIPLPVSVLSQKYSAVSQSVLSLLCFIFIGEVQSCKFDHSRLFRHKFREVLLIRAVGRFQFPARFMLLMPSAIFLAERKTCFPARIEARTVVEIFFLTIHF